MEANCSDIYFISKCEKDIYKVEHWQLSRLNFNLCETYNFGYQTSSLTLFFQFSKMKNLVKKASNFSTLSCFIPCSFIFSLNGGAYYKKDANKFIKKKFTDLKSLKISHSTFTTQRTQKESLSGKTGDLTKNIGFITESITLNSFLINEKEFRSLLMASCKLEKFRFELCRILNKNKKTFFKPRSQIKLISFYQMGVLDAHEDFERDLLSTNISLQSDFSFQNPPLLSKKKDLYQILNIIKSCVILDCFNTIEFIDCDAKLSHLEQFMEAQPEIKRVWINIQVT
ncbi:unnamed protein product [Moneuplotes crassus]|uniref:Uncharacterized protein n=1 Tax=Euplotes crassus TaxID=5936 RepID=A0AAD1XQZ6_EUPCR|nr:unnamed protein product [Moneuplotes crassus]